MEIAPIKQISPEVQKASRHLEKTVDQKSLDSISIELKSDINVEGGVLALDYNKEINQVIAKVIDPETKEVIRQIPSEEFVKIIENIKQKNEQLRGVFVSDTA